MGEFAEDKFLIREVCGPSIRGLVGGKERISERASAGLARRPALLLRVDPKDDNSFALLSN